MLVFVIFNICTKYDTIFDKCCSILYKDFKTSKYLLTFPNIPIFIIDNLTAILVLHLHDKVFNTSEYTEFINNYINNIEVDKNGIIISMIPTNRKIYRNIRGSQFAYAIFLLSKINKEVAYKYYVILKEHFIISKHYMVYNLYGVKEYMKDISLLPIQCLFASPTLYHVLLQMP